MAQALRAGQEKKPVNLRIHRRYNFEIEALAYIEAPEDTGTDRGSDDSGRVACHGVHEQEVGWVLFLAHYMNFARRTGHGRNAGSPKERIDFFFEEEVHDFGENQTRGRRDAEGDSAEEEES